MNWFKRAQLWHLRGQPSGPLWDLLNSSQTRSDIAALVQKEYDSWIQDETGYAEGVGYGGICNLVAEEICHYLNCRGILCKTYSAEEDHTAVIAATKDECYGVDVHWSHYEVCKGLYCYEKVKDIKITAEDVSIYPEYRDALMDAETGDILSEWQEEEEEEE